MTEEMKKQEERCRKIVDAVVRRAEKVCPGSLALIGVYGSFAAGRTHPWSDLDLLILINDEAGYRLSAAFVQEDLQVGHDLYCTTWDSLRAMARCEDPNLGKLMDSRIVYCAEERYLTELEQLRRQARERLEAPFGPEDLEKAETAWREALRCYALSALAETDGEKRRMAGAALFFVENAVALLNKRYFRMGTEQRGEELSAMPRRPGDLWERIEGVAAAPTGEAAEEKLKALMKAVGETFRQAREDLAAQQLPPAAESLRGTYEEMVSNWRGKLRRATRIGDRHLAFLSLTSFDGMVEEIRSAGRIGEYDGVSVYDPDDLEATAERFGALLERYLTEYRRAGLEPERYGDIDEFIEKYLQA